ncbi:MAG TPA: hypothetical protein VG370_34940 [Chloroflexota bacterium]|jgi:hypothetical protein|nr:hypothetical protein [Chloroflexota bacterium]
MSAENIAVVTGVIVALTQLSKWMRLVQDRHGPLVVLGLSAAGVVLWAVSFEAAFSRAMIWPYFAAWIVVATSSAGVYGFTRALPEAVTATKTPPAGAGGQPTGRV